MALRKAVLRKYREILGLSRSWRALEQAETEAERSYIKEEARRLFRKNKNVSHLVKGLDTTFQMHTFAHAICNSD
jgi:hypothetical protein